MQLTLSIKGASANVEATQLNKIAVCLEEKAREENLELLPIIENFEIELEKLRTQFLRYPF